MISKKDAVTLAVLGIGGIALASAVAGKEEEEDFPGARRGLLGGGGVAPGKKDLGDITPPSFTIPQQPAAVVFPDPVDYTPFLRDFFSTPIDTSLIGGNGGAVSKKTNVIYGGYMPSGKTYVFGGKAFESQAASEIVSRGYSPTLGAAFGISPEISSGGSGYSGERERVHKQRTSKKERYYDGGDSYSRGGGGGMSYAQASAAAFSGGAHGVSL